MKTSIARGASLLFVSRLVKRRKLLLVITFISFLQFSETKAQSCSSCCITSFPVLTVYQTTQTGHGLGFGVEAGNWKKETGKLSYFVGTSMVWANSTNTDAKSGTTPKQLLLSFYVKGQYKITNHLYAVIAPGIVNMTYAELQTGLRYVVPITRVIGIGVEPSYAFNQKQFVVNANVHFALR